MRDAGIKVWVLTGDKVETAINIAFSCKLIDNEMELFIIDALSTAEIYDQMQAFNKQSRKIGRSREKAVVIGGESLTKILKAEGENKEKMQGRFTKLCDEAKTVLCCRVSPK